jgi:uncharacterized membrane protein required for colicin V production
MLAAAVHNSGPWWHHLGFNWFDVALLALLVIGFWRGRKRGMTKECLPTLQWVAILLAAGLGHTFLGGWFQQQGFIRQVFGNHFNEHTAALVSAYLVIMLAVVIVFAALRRKYHSKLEGSSVFGGNEYYWGVVAGLVRYLCMLLVALALLNAPFYSQAEIAASEAYNNRWYAGGVKNFNGDLLPSMYDVQDNVFKQSLVGPLIKQNLSVLLINSIPTGKATAHS